MGSVAGGAHFSAIHGQTDHEPELRKTYSHLSMSDVKLDGKRRQVVEDCLELFSSRPTLEIFERSWRKDAVFEDPLSKCVGYHEYAPQWFSMPKIFPTSRTLKMNVVASTYGPSEPNRIVYEQEQEYTIRFLGHKQVMRSLVVIDLDDEDMIVKLEDKWDGRDQPRRFGSYYLRRLNAKALPWIVKVPTPKK